MQSWLDVEQFFQKTGVQFERKDWIYLCHLAGRQFYYSPQTGKWRLKGKKAWQRSQNLQEFITQALNYFSTNPQSHQTQNNSQNNSQNHQRNNSRQKTKTTSQNSQKHSNYRSHSSKQNVNWDTTDEIRPEFLSLFGQFLQIQRDKEYKVGWILYSLLDRLLPTPIEICWLCVVFQYSSGWAFHQVKNLYGQADWKAILTLIENNRAQWWHDFNTRWGTQRDPRSDPFGNRSHQREKYHHQPQDFHRVSTYQRYLNILKISFPFSQHELKTAYRKRALETHPDLGGTAEAFREVNSAYQFLLGAPC